MNESDLHRAIGSIEGMLACVREEQDAARAARNLIYSKLDAMARTVDDIDRRLKSVEPHAQEFSRWQQRWIGGVMLIGVVASAAGALVVTIGKKAWAAIAG